MLLFHMAGFMTNLRNLNGTTHLAIQGELFVQGELIFKEQQHCMPAVLRRELILVCHSTHTMWRLYSKRSKLLI